MALELLSFAPSSIPASELQRTVCESMQRARYHHEYVEVIKSSSVLPTPTANDDVDFQTVEHILQILINCRAFQQFLRTLSKSSEVATQIPVLACEFKGSCTSVCFPFQLNHHSEGIITDTENHHNDCSQSGFNPHGLRYQSRNAIDHKHYADSQNANAKLKGKASHMGGDATAALTTSTFNDGLSCNIVPSPQVSHSRKTFSTDSNNGKENPLNDRSKNESRWEAKHVRLEYAASSSRASEEHLQSGRSRSSDAGLAGEGDGGHKCAGFPCPTCHRTRRNHIDSVYQNVGSYSDSR